ncbi:hypothetical protein CHS0354_009535 [Potamilus streckersoni]|uniref:Uncharacterized protein n=1 Tax=Potamilus streckersoni TaxID=2493646 RepID=A0AAE0SPT9_9BIVA|nr:hypothetical protein CHS0354_009535 [Potamilus streckersoni]
MTTTIISKQGPKYFQRYEFIEYDSEEVHTEFQCDKAPEGSVRTWSSIGKVKSKKCRIPNFSSDSLVLSKFRAKVPFDAKGCDILSSLFLPDEKLVLPDLKIKKPKLFNKYQVACINEKWRLSLDTFVDCTLTRLGSIDIGHQCYGMASCQEIIIVNQLEDNELLVTLDISYKATSTSNDLKLARVITVEKKVIIYYCGNRSYTMVKVEADGKQLGVLISEHYGLNRPTEIC